MDRVIHLTADLACRPEVAFSHFTSDRLLQAWLANDA
jgi:hypothetical protein